MSRTIFEGNDTKTVITFGSVRSLLQTAPATSVTELPHTATDTKQSESVTEYHLPVCAILEAT